MKNHSVMMTGSLATGAAASATMLVFGNQTPAPLPAGAVSPAGGHVSMLVLNVPDYTTGSPTTTIYIIEGTTNIVLYQSAALAENAKYAIPVDIWVNPGDYIYIAGSATNGATVTLTGTVKMEVYP